MIFRNKLSAFQFLKSFLKDYLSMMRLRTLISRYHKLGGPRSMDDHQVLELLADRLVSGQLIILKVPRKIWSGSPADSVVEEEEEAAPPATVLEEERHWIKLKVVYEETEEPVSGVPFKIKLPTGEIREFHSDSNGEVEVNDVPDNAWDIMEMMDSEALEVVEVG